MHMLASGPPAPSHASCPASASIDEPLAPLSASVPPNCLNLQHAQSPGSFGSIKAHRNVSGLPWQWEGCSQREDWARKSSARSRAWLAQLNLINGHPSFPNQIADLHSCTCASTRQDLAVCLEKGVEHRSNGSLHMRLALIRDVYHHSLEEAGCCDSRMDRNVLANMKAPAIILDSPADLMHSCPVPCVCVSKVARASNRPGTCCI